jgi:serine/threonine protein kinase
MGCLDDDMLRSFLNGRLGDAASEPVERHLEGCPSCLERLDELSARERRTSPSSEWLLADDPATMTTLIQRLCRAGDSVAGIAGPATGGAHETRSSEGLLAPAEPPAAPAYLGRYRVLHSLGVGGMGAVYLAEDPELRRTVAVKVPHFAGPAAAQGVARQRFLREARAAAAVRHPRVCPIYDVGEQDSTPYVVMAFIEGRSLADRLKREGPFTDPRSAVALAIQVAQGLAAVHDRGLVHRDLKPSNILLDAAGDAFLCDFGLARREDDADRLTATGALVGTLAYMAPEQVDAAGGFGPVTARTDVFSIGVVLFETLTGRLPFATGSSTQLLYQIVHAAPTPPRKLRPDLDPRLEAVILKALAKTPEERWTDSRAFAAALQALATPQRPDRSPAWLISACLGVLLIALGSFWGWQALTTPGDDAEHAEGPLPPGAAPLPEQPSPQPGATTINSPGRIVYAVAFSPDGKLLATAGDDNAIHIYDVATTKSVQRLVHDIKIRCLVFAPDGAKLASAGTDQTVTLWDTATWAKERTIADAKAPIVWVAFTPNGENLATIGHRQKFAILWDLTTGK